MLEKAQAGKSALLIAPTGAGKTLAGFLPSLIELSGGNLPRLKARGRGIARRGIHTLYISPLKALAVDVARNVERPIAEMALDIRIETRTGDTPQSKRQRQKIDPPDILMTTPEQLELLIAAREADDLFGDLRTVIFDELHALVTSKRGDLLALGLARLRRLAPHVRTVGLSATVSNPDELQAWLVPQLPDADGVLPEPPISCASQGAQRPKSGYSNPKSAFLGPGTRRATLSRNSMPP